MFGSPVGYPAAFIAAGRGILATALLSQGRSQATATRERSEWSGQPIAGDRSRAHTPTVPAV